MNDNKINIYDEKNIKDRSEDVNLTNGDKNKGEYDSRLYSSG